MKRSTSYLLGIAAVMILFPFFYTWWQYKKALDRQSQEAYQSFIDQELHGRLERISHPTGHQGEAVLGVSTISSNFNTGLLSIGLICIDASFLLTVNEGDSVHKNSGSAMVRFCGLDIECVQYELHFCGPGAPDQCERPSPLTRIFSPLVHTQHALACRECATRPRPPVASAPSACGT